MNLKDIRDDQYNLARLRKINSICHAIAHAAKPSLILPLMLAIGVFMYRRYDSKELPNILATLGFCSSYYNVRLFEASVLAADKDPIYPDA